MSEENKEDENKQGGADSEVKPEITKPAPHRTTTRKPRTKKAVMDSLPNEKRYKEEGDLLIPV